ncbi:TIGR04325 family methyltransferase [Chlorogloeopsis sp. ULAP02]|uniref:TIGR04325 family methyltransferase n=1 Tax=Chlorogloeopsis sp. ULAP02 TaxID=3107926 RepID=UPI0031374FF5
MKSIIKQIPFARQFHRYIKEQEYKRKFATNCYGCFWGIFETFEEARQAAPQTKSIGYDNTELAQEYQEMLEHGNWESSGRMIASYDYPVLFWLKSIINHENTNIFDFGGNVGIHFYTYSKYIKYPETLKWTVCDLPEIIRVGKQIAEKRHINSLFFTSNFEDANNKDIFIASGSIQYVENLATQISKIRKPKHLLINRLPIYNGRLFVTLQNGGKVFYPQYVFNKTEFIEAITSIGYELIDIWEDNVDSCMIPFHPESSVPAYSGLYFQLRF